MNDNMTYSLTWGSLGLAPISYKSLNMKEALCMVFVAWASWVIPLPEIKIKNFTIGAFKEYWGWTWADYIIVTIAT